MIRSGGRYYVVDGVRIPEKEYKKQQKQQKAKAKPVKEKPEEINDGIAI